MGMLLVLGCVLLTACGDPDYQTTQQQPAEAAPAVTPAEQQSGGNGDGGSVRVNPRIVVSLCRAEDHPQKYQPPYLVMITCDVKSDTPHTVYSIHRTYDQAIQTLNWYTNVNIGCRLAGVYILDKPALLVGKPGAYYLAP